jgi:hypothetical protein
MTDQVLPGRRNHGQQASQVVISMDHRRRLDVVEKQWEDIEVGATPPTQCQKNGGDSIEC